MSRDYIFTNARAWDRQTGEPVDVNLCYALYTSVKEEFEQSKYILDNDLLVSATQYFGHLATGNRKPRIETIGQETIFTGGREVGALTGTNTKEGLDAAYAAGDRILAMNFAWTEDQFIVAIKNRQQFESLLDKPVQRLTHEDFLKSKLKSGLTPLDLKRTLDWLSKNKDSIMIAFTDQRSIDFSKYLFDEYRESLSRFVVVVDAFEKYYRLGYLNVERIALDADALKNSPEVIEAFVEHNPVYMVITSDGRMSEEKKKAIAGWTNLFIREGDKLLRYTPE
jgi:hypothetical protein